MKVMEQPFFVQKVVSNKVIIYCTYLIDFSTIDSYEKRKFLMAIQMGHIQKEIIIPKFANCYPIQLFKLHKVRL